MAQRMALNIGFIGWIGLAAHMPYVAIGAETCGPDDLNRILGEASHSGTSPAPKTLRERGVFIDSKLIHQNLGPIQIVRLEGGKIYFRGPHSSNVLATPRETFEKSVFFKEGTPDAAKLTTQRAHDLVPPEDVARFLMGQTLKRTHLSRGKVGKRIWTSIDLKTQARLKELEQTWKPFEKLETAYLSIVNPNVQHFRKTASWIENEKELAQLLSHELETTGMNWVQAGLLDVLGYGPKGNWAIEGKSRWAANNYFPGSKILSHAIFAFPEDIEAYYLPYIWEHGLNDFFKSTGLTPGQHWFDRLQLPTYFFPGHANHEADAFSKLMYLAKSQGDRAASEEIIRRFLAKNRDLIDWSTVDLIVPTPHSSVDKQATTQLAEALAVQTGSKAKVYPFFIRAAESDAQKSAHGLESKIHNAAKAFMTPNRTDPEFLGKTVIILDDNVNTGATLTALQLDAYKLGASKVIALPLARLAGGG